ncbi:MAG TPA: hypothetical protein EYP59_18340 [Thiotrichaceae bacterium]|nr:hypothetical protein [Thiotrichaceae bacterium]
MSLEKLDNLVKTGQLKLEPPNQDEFDGMIASAKARLQDSQLTGLSADSQFHLAYGAAHALSLAAMRWHGYRSDSRYLVFQCLEQTLGVEKVKWRVLDQCHKQRNIAEYEGYLEIAPQLLKELIEISEDLLQRVESLGNIKKQKATL